MQISGLAGSSLFMIPAEYLSLEEQVVLFRRSPRSLISAIQLLAGSQLLNLPRHQLHLLSLLHHQQHLHHNLSLFSKAVLRSLILITYLLLLLVFHILMIRLSILFTLTWSLLISHLLHHLLRRLLHHHQRLIGPPLLQVLTGLLTLVQIST